MIPTPTKQKALARRKKKLPRNIPWEWDCEYDINSHLQEKNRVLKSETEKSNYIKTLLQGFLCKDPEGGAPDLVKFMDSLHITGKSHMSHLAEENGTDDDDDVIVDPQHKYFMDHVRPHGKSYVLDIPEDGVYVKYEPANYNRRGNVNRNRVKRRGRKPKGANFSAAIMKGNVKCPNVASEPQKHVNNLKGRCGIMKRKGRRSKGANFSAAIAMNGNVKGSDVASKAQKHDVSDLMGWRTSKRLKTQSYSEKSVIEDSDDAVEDITWSVRGQIVEHCGKEYNGSRLFKEKLIEEVKAPYSEEEYNRLLHDITVRRPAQHHRELRGGIKIYEKSHLGKSYLDHYVDLANKIERARDDHPRVLNLMRGFFYWLKNLSHEGAFAPWTDPSCLDVLSQKLEG